MKHSCPYQGTIPEFYWRGRSKPQQILNQDIRFRLRFEASTSPTQVFSVAFRPATSKNSLKFVDLKTGNTLRKETQEFPRVVSSVAH